MGGLRLRRAHVRAEAVADCRGLQLGAVLPAAGEGGDERHVEDRLLLREHEGRLHESGAVRTQSRCEDEAHDRPEEGRDPEWQVLRVRWAATRPEGQAAREEGPAPFGPGSLCDELAGQRRHR